MRASLACVSLREDSKEEGSEEEEEAAEAMTTGGLLERWRRRCCVFRARAVARAFGHSLTMLLLLAIEHVAAWRLAEGEARSIFFKVGKRDY